MNGKTAKLISKLSRIKGLKRYEHRQLKKQYQNLSKKHRKEFKDEIRKMSNL